MVILAYLPVNNGFFAVLSLIAVDFCPLIPKTIVP
jgi:hypothetical protein